RTCPHDGSPAMRTRPLKMSPTPWLFPARVLNLSHRGSDFCRRLDAGRRFNRRSDQVMKLVAASLSLTLIVYLPGVSRAATDEDAQKIIRQHLHQLLPADQIGGIAGAIRMDGRAVFLGSGLG